MAREDNKLTTAFNKVTEDVTVTRNTNTEYEDVTPTDNTKITLDNVKDNLDEEQRKRNAKKRIEETHKRATFLVRKDLQKRLDRLVRHEKGLTKTLFVNKALEALLNAYEY